MLGKRGGAVSLPCAPWDNNEAAKNTKQNKFQKSIKNTGTYWETHAHGEFHRAVKQAGMQ